MHKHAKQHARTFERSINSMRSCHGRFAASAAVRPLPQQCIEQQWKVSTAAYNPHAHAQHVASSQNNTRSIRLS
jgi:hypothetical protein